MANPLAMLYPIQVFAPDGHIVHDMIVGSVSTIPALGDELHAGDGSALVVDRIQIEGGTHKVFTRSRDVVH
ncbi:MAG TPA: hypothetical protein VGG28_34320 [Kofleriaceae bacterium]|jgi:hypothetical protein